MGTVLTQISGRQLLTRRSKASAHGIRLHVPTGPAEAAGAVTAGADYILMDAGLFGLVVARVRPKRRKDED